MDLYLQDLKINTLHGLIYLGFIPTSKISRPEKLSKKKSKNKISSKSCLYIESQINLSKSMITDRMNYSITIKYNTYKLLNLF